MLRGLVEARRHGNLTGDSKLCTPAQLRWDHVSRQDSQPYPIFQSEPSTVLFVAPRVPFAKVNLHFEEKTFCLEENWWQNSTPFTSSCPALRSLRLWTEEGSTKLSNSPLFCWGLTTIISNWRQWKKSFLSFLARLVFLTLGCCFALLTEPLRLHKVWATRMVCVVTSRGKQRHNALLGARPYGTPFVKFLVPEITHIFCHI